MRPKSLLADGQSLICYSETCLDSQVAIAFSVTVAIGFWGFEGTEKKQAATGNPGTALWFLAVPSEFLRFSFFFWGGGLRVLVAQSVSDPLRLAMEGPERPRSIGHLTEVFGGLKTWLWGPK